VAGHTLILSNKRMSFEESVINISLLIIGQCTKRSMIHIEILYSCKT